MQPLTLTVQALGYSEVADRRLPEKQRVGAIAMLNDRYFCWTDGGLDWGSMQQVGHDANVKGSELKVCSSSPDELAACAIGYHALS